jgi:hypothetical protein
MILSFAFALLFICVCHAKVFEETSNKDNVWNEFPSFNEVLRADKQYKSSRSLALKSKHYGNSKNYHLEQNDDWYNDWYSYYYYDSYSYLYNYAYSYAYYRPVTNDDFGNLRVDDVVTAPILPGDAGYSNVAGYVFYQFYDQSFGNGCGSSTPSYSVGVMSGVCVTDGGMSYMVTFSDNACSDLRIQWFADKLCTQFLYADALTTFTQCRSGLQGSSLANYVGGCSEGFTLPLQRDSAVYGSVFCSVTADPLAIFID